MASATFSPVNTTLVPDTLVRDETNPLTPRPNTATTSHLQQPPSMGRDDATTPTRANFGALANQRPLPEASSPFIPAIPITPSESKQPLVRGDSQYSAKSRDSEDVDMDSDGGEEGSDDEASLNADGTRSSKKKGKSQKFYCSDYPPCTLSFTRSEHLARHIRKHTGERPFECHCSRRFSRLDNLRQHAQTVHQNEDIPPESLAATGTRFQRQVRTDRVRPPGRSRASTSGSVGPIRGHQRNSLSMSSMTSVGSSGSVYGAREDARRRPPPLVMAGDRSRYSGEIYRPDSSGGYYRTQSPGFNTPTSATFSTGENSPRWTGMQSPASTHSRTASIYNGHRPPGRRLSVPSAGNPFQSPHGNAYGPPALGQMNASNMGAYSPSSSMISSPTNSTHGSIFARRESITQADENWRRRTWHPSTNFDQSFTSRLQQVTTANHYATGPIPQPPVVPSNAPPLQNMRLPGIESFDPLPRPTTPVRRQPSPMMLDTPTRAPMHPQYQPERPTSQHWDQGINRNMNRLEIAPGPAADAANQWANETNQAVQHAREQARHVPGVRFEESPYSARPQTSSGPYQPHPQHASAPPITPREAKRQAWYHGPVAQTQPIQRTSPAESSGSEAGIPGTPSSSEYNPAIVHSNGFVERHGALHPHDPRVVPSNGYSVYPPHSGAEAYGYGPQRQAPVQQHSQAPKERDMHRLEALVAVATSEEVASSAY